MATGPGGHTDAEKDAMRKARHDAAAEKDPLLGAAKDLAHNYPTPHDVNDFSTDDLKAILRIIGDQVFMGVTPALHSLPGGQYTTQQRVNFSYCQGGAGPDPNSQPGTPASTFNIDSPELGIHGDPSQGTPYTPTPAVLAFISEYRAYEKAVIDAKNAAGIGPGHNHPHRHGQ